VSRILHNPATDPPRLPRLINQSTRGGAWTEVIDAPFAEGATVVTRIAVAANAAPGAAGGAAGNPLLATPARR
jgi:hypothetical protein